MRPVSRINTLLAITLALVSPLIAANEADSGSTNFLKLVTPSWKNFTEENGQGFYFDLMRMVYEPMGVSVIYEIAPWVRCEKLVLEDKADALVGSYKEKADLYHYPSKPIWLDISAVAYKKSTIDWSGISSLNRRNVGWIRGYGYDAYIDADMMIHKVNDNKHGWKMLMLNHLDFYIDSLTDLNLYIEDMGIDRNAIATQPLITEKMYIRFSDTQKGKKLADIYDHRIISLIETGQLKTLYEKWGYAELYSKFVAQL